MPTSRHNGMERCTKYLIPLLRSGSLGTAGGRAGMPAATFRAGVGCRQSRAVWPFFQQQALSTVRSDWPITSFPKLIGSR